MNSSSSAVPPTGAPPDGGRRSRRSGRTALPAVATALALGATQVALAAPGHAATVAQLSGTRVAVGHAPAVPGAAVSATAPAGSTKLTLDIELNTPNSAALKTFAGTVNDPASPSYHHFLAAGDVAKQFGAPAAEVAAVDAALKAAGLTPGAVTADGLFIPVTATVDQAKAAFGTDFAGYQLAGRHVYANKTAPLIDAAVAPDVAGIVGLDNVAYAAPQYVRSNKKAKANGLSAATVRAHASVSPNYAVPTCSVINTDLAPMHNGTDYYTADAVSNIYGIDSLLAGGDNGSGVTVAVFELEAYDSQGVGDLLNCYGSGSKVTQINVDGGPTAPADYNTGVGLEANLDIENIADLAPGVNILDYNGPDATASTTGDTQVLDTYRQMVTDDKAKVISTSWGLCEAGGSAALLSGENTIFAEAAAQGQTVIAASGDAGSTDCYRPGKNLDSSLAVDDPASQPTVLGVGGTSMTGLSNPPQSVWNSVQTDANGHHYYGAGGGGVSSVWNISSNVPSSNATFQQGVTGAGYSAHCANAGTTGCRQVPDVSGLADPTEGYVIAEYNSGDGGVDLIVIGGTSGAAPVWAAIYALADASSSCVANGNAGEAAPALYAAGKTPAGYSVFRDITTGNNGISAYSAPYAYPATSGYDLASGWGTPAAPGVVNTACKVSNVSAASYYVPVGPTRILDTRKSIGGTGPVGASGGTVKLQITGNSGVATSNVTAVALNVTVTANGSAGNAVVYPDGSAMPATSNLNWAANQTVPNLVVVPVGADGKVDLTNSSAGTVQFVADLAGYFTSNAAATGISTYTAAGPVRAMDTRKNLGATGPVAGGGVASLAVGGTTVGGVAIPSGITAVVLNVTNTAPTSNGYLTVYPNQTAAGGPVARPTVSNLNFSANQTIANLVIVPVGADGKVDFYNGSAGTTQVIADIAGYYSAGTAGAKYHALGPDRIVDTRIGLGEASIAPLASGGTFALPIPSSATAILANLTVASPTSGGYLTAFPAGSTRPTVSNLNFTSGQAVPNLAIVPSNGGVDFYNGSGGTLRLIVDLGGYFSAS